MPSPPSASTSKSTVVPTTKTGEKVDPFAALPSNVGLQVVHFLDLRSADRFSKTSGACRQIFDGSVESSTSVKCPALFVLNLLDGFGADLDFLGWLDVTSLARLREVSIMFKTSVDAYLISDRVVPLSPPLPPVEAREERRKIADEDSLSLRRTRPVLHLLSMPHSSKPEHEDASVRRVELFRNTRCRTVADLDRAGAPWCRFYLLRAGLDCRQEAVCRLMSFKEGNDRFAVKNDWSAAEKWINLRNNIYPFSLDRREPHRISLLRVIQNPFYCACAMKLSWNYNDYPQPAPLSCFFVVLFHYCALLKSKQAQETAAPSGSDERGEEVHNTADPDQHSKHLLQEQEEHDVTMKEQEASSGDGGEKVNEDDDGKTKTPDESTSKPSSFSDLATDANLQAKDRLAIQQSWRQSGFALLMLVIDFARYFYRVENGRLPESEVDDVVLTEVGDFLLDALEKGKPVTSFCADGFFWTTTPDQRVLQTEAPTWSKRQRRTLLDHWLQAEIEFGSEGLFQILRRQEQLTRILPLLASTLWNQTLRWLLRRSARGGMTSDAQLCFQFLNVLDPSTASLAYDLRDEGSDLSYNYESDNEASMEVSGDDEDGSDEGDACSSDAPVEYVLKITNEAVLATDYAHWFHCRAKAARTENDPENLFMMRNEPLRLRRVNNFSYMKKFSLRVRKYYEQTEEDARNFFKSAVFLESPRVQQSVAKFLEACRPGLAAFAENEDVRWGCSALILLPLLDLLVELAPVLGKGWAATICGYMFPYDKEELGRDDSTLPRWLKEPCKRRVATLDGQNEVDLNWITAALHGKQGHLFEPEETEEDTNSIPRGVLTSHQAKELCRKRLAENPWLLGARAPKVKRRGAIVVGGDSSDSEFDYDAALSGSDRDE
ncbi:unnamed protein product [Amoebophrya sp. A120]|nr:unnamed protein product [Amoebophrya sp. A120]|eukprot:GSA120T00020919001.1